MWFSFIIYLFKASILSFSKQALKNNSAITSNEARADVSAKSLWIRGQTAYGDVRVFKPIS